MVSIDEFSLLWLVLLLSPPPLLYMRVRFVSVCVCARATLGSSSPAQLAALAGLSRVRLTLAFGHTRFVALDFSLWEGGGRGKKCRFSNHSEHRSAFLRGRGLASAAMNCCAGDAGRGGGGADRNLARAIVLRPSLQLHFAH